MQVANNVFIHGHTPAALTSAMRLIGFMSFLVCMAAMHVLVMVVQSVAITGDAANRHRRARSIFEAAGRSVVGGLVLPLGVQAGSRGVKKCFDSSL